MIWKKEKSHLSVLCRFGAIFSVRWQKNECRVFEWLWFVSDHNRLVFVALLDLRSYNYCVVLTACSICFHKDGKSKKNLWIFDYTSLVHIAEMSFHLSKTFSQINEYFWVVIHCYRILVLKEVDIFFFSLLPPFWPKVFLSFYILTYM